MQTTSNRVIFKTNLTNVFVACDWLHLSIYELEYRFNFIIQQKIAASALTQQPLIHNYSAAAQFPGSDFFIQGHSIHSLY